MNLIPIKVTPFKPKCENCKWFKNETCMYFVNYSKFVINPNTYPIRTNDARKDNLSCGPLGRYFKIMC